VLNAPSGVIQSDLGLADWQANLLQAALSIVALFGAQFSGGLLDRAGRRAFLLYTAVLFGLGGALPIGASFLKAASPGAAYGLLLAARMVVGLGVGAASTACPLYLGEIAPSHLKGAYGSIAQFQVRPAGGAAGRRAASSVPRDGERKRGERDSRACSSPPRAIHDDVRVRGRANPCPHRAAAQVTVWILLAEVAGIVMSTSALWGYL
jgi:hypothetical protein